MFAYNTCVYINIYIYINICFYEKKKKNVNNCIIIRIILYIMCVCIILTVVPVAGE